MKDKTYQRREKQDKDQLSSKNGRSLSLSHIHMNNKAITAPSINSPREEDQQKKQTNEIILIYIYVKIKKKQNQCVFSNLHRNKKVKQDDRLTRQRKRKTRINMRIYYVCFCGNKTKKREYICIYIYMSSRRR